MKGSTFYFYEFVITEYIILFLFFINVIVTFLSPDVVLSHVILKILKIIIMSFFRKKNNKVDINGVMYIYASSLGQYSFRFECNLNSVTVCKQDDIPF